MASKQDQKFEITPDEIERISEALKKEEFRKLLVEYAEEISNPENKKKYEEEIAQLEGERGVDVKFIHPKPGYVLRSSIDGVTKAFINICQNDGIEKASFTRASDGGEAKGMHWNIPHSFSPQREDRDKSGARCVVFDVVFHPDTVRMALSNSAFRRAIDSTAVDGIVNQLGAKLDKNNVKTMKKLKFKGTPTATVIRKRKEHFVSKAEDASDPLSRLPYPYDGAPATKAPAPRSAPVAREPAEAKTGRAQDAGYAVPKYSIVNQYHTDISDFACNLNGASNRPKALVVEVCLPLLSSASSIALDVLDKRLQLQSETPARYRLDITLPYPVDDDAGTAKFDKKKKCLLVTLPVLPVPFNAKEQQCGNDAADTKLQFSNAPTVANETDVMPTVDHAASNGCASDTNNVSQYAGLGAGENGFVKHSPEERGADVEVPQLPRESTARAEGTARQDVAVCDIYESTITGSPPVHGCATVKTCAEVEKNVAVAPPTGCGGPEPCSGFRPEVSAQTTLNSAEDAVDPPTDKLSSVEEAEPLASAAAQSLVEHQDSGERCLDGLVITESVTGNSREAASSSSALPRFTYDQEDATVTFVMEVKNVKRDSFSVTFLKCDAVAASGSDRWGTCFRASFCSVGSGHFPMYYDLSFRFPEGCVLDCTRFSVDVSNTNAVLVLWKDGACLGSWDSFWCGASLGDGSAGTVKHFVTQSSLHAELLELENRCQEAQQLDAMATTVHLDVKSLRDECLSINITELDVVGTRDSTDPVAAAEDDYESLSSPEIVHTKEPPRDLQGILKKQTSSSSHTLSESSDGPDDASANSASDRRQRSGSGGEGASSESNESSDENAAAARLQRKKAVTFNEHVDETAYQPTAAVTMLHQTLKNKRKRQKKKEDRKQHAASHGSRRRRNSSGGSITTDEEEIIAVNCNSLKGSVGATKAAQRTKNRTAPSPRGGAAEPSGDNDAALPQDGAAVACGKVADGINNAKGIRRDSGDSNLVASETTACISKSHQGANGIKPSCEGKYGLSNGSAALEQGDTQCSLERDLSGSIDSGGDRVCKDSNGCSCDATGNIDSDDDSSNDAGHQGDGAQFGNVRPVMSNPPVDTRASSTDPGALGNHTTKCAFDFRNSIIFELDE